MKIINNISQLSAEWFSFRAGRPSASCFDKIYSPTGKVSTQAKQYMYQLAGERITKKKEESYHSQAMIEGIEKEEKARIDFEMITDFEVKQVASCLHDSELFSCSPDGLMDDSGLEIKCPKMTTHVGYLVDNKLPTKYIPQVQGSMLVTGFDTWWFMSYYPGLKYLIVKVERDDNYCNALEIELKSFCEKLTVVENKLRGIIDVFQGQLIEGR